MSKQHNYFFYIVTNPDGTVLYCGMTNNLQARLVEHYLSRGNEETFAGKYHCFNLIYYERYQYVQHAIARETEVKKWSRRKKMELIESMNQGLKALNEEVCDIWPPAPDLQPRNKYG